VNSKLYQSPFRLYNPDLVTAPEHALKPALKEWSDNNLNHFADQNDIRTITKRINGGLMVLLIERSSLRSYFHC